MDLASSERTDYFVTYLHVFGAIGSLLDLVGIFLIVHFSGKAMKAWRWYLLQIQTITFLMDVYFSFLMTPVPLFPLPAGYTLGILYKWFGVSSFFQITIVTALMSAQMTSFVVAFVYKHQTILPAYSRMKLKRPVQVVVIVVNYIPMTYCVALIYLSADDSFRNDPNYAQLLERFPSLVAYDLHNTYMAIFINAIILGNIAASTFMLGSTFIIFRLLRQQKTVISNKVYQLHRQTSIALVLQALVPLATWVCPVVVCLVLILVRSNFTSDLSLVLIAIFATHGPLSTIVLLLTIKSYRRVLCQIKCSVSLQMEKSTVHVVNTNRSRKSELSGRLTSTDKTFT